jgi:uncharacterized protein YbjT (DUF2867 family)
MSSETGSDPSPAPLTVAVVGGHGQIARLLLRRLAADGHRGLGVIRREEQAADIRADGGEPVLFDLESESAAALAERIAGADAVVFAAGAGPGSGSARKMTVDRNGALLAADAAELAGITRLLVVSALAADDFEVGSDEIFQVYLRAKSEADALIRDRDLDWTIVRPGGLTDEPPTGRVRIAERTGPGSVPRADVAEVLLELLVGGGAVRRQFELISGADPIPAALDRLG